MRTVDPLLTVTPEEKRFAKMTISQINSLCTLTNYNGQNFASQMGIRFPL